MTSTATYPTTTSRCSHRGEHYPLTTRVEAWVYSEAHQTMICPECGIAAQAALGGWYHREDARR